MERLCFSVAIEQMVMAGTIFTIIKYKQIMKLSIA